MTDLWTHLDIIDTDSFLAFARLHLGSVEMPYNKQRLAQRLVSFFSDASVRANTVASVSEDEAKLLSLVQIFGPMDEEQLVALLPEERHKGATRMIHLLMNRALLIYNAERKLDLNSAFDYSGLLNTSVISQHFKKEGRTLRLRETLKATASLVNISQPRRISSYAHRNASAYAHCFPLLGVDQLECLMQAFIETSLAMGMMVMEDGVCRLSREACLDFFALPLSDIQALLVSSGKGGEGACLIARLASTFSSDFTRQAFSSLYRGDGRDELLQAYSNLSFIFDEREEENTEQRVTVTPDMQLRYASAGNASLFFLYTSPVLIDEKLITLSLDMESVRAGFCQGLDGKAILTQLYGDGDVDDNVRFRIEDWMERYSAFSISEGIYLETNSRNAALIEKMPLMQIHIMRRIGTCGFLMKKSTEEQWRRLLLYIGFDMLPSTEREKDEAESRLHSRPALPWPGECDLASLKADFQRGDDSYKKALLEKAALLAEGQRQACVELIASGQIVAESQMAGESARRIGLVVSGFDHQGKVRLLSKGVGKADSLFEITGPDGSGIYTVVSMQNEKSAAVAAVLEDREGTTTVMPVSRIFRIRELLL